MSGSHSSSLGCHSSSTCAAVGSQSGSSLLIMRYTFTIQFQKMLERKSTVKIFVGISAEPCDCL